MRITKALIRLLGWAGWSAPLLFANPGSQVFLRLGLLATLTVLKDFFLKVNYWKKSIEDKKIMKNCPACKELRKRDFAGLALIVQWYCINLYTKVQGLEHDHGQIDSRVRAQRLSAAHHKVTWSILIGFKYSIAIGKQRLPVCKGKGHCKRNMSVLRKWLLLACHRSQISGSVLDVFNLHLYSAAYNLIVCPLCWN